MCGGDILGSSGSSDYFCNEGRAAGAPAAGEPAAEEPAAGYSGAFKNGENLYFLVFVTVIKTILFKA
jgi:hypothetical protein